MTAQNSTSKQDVLSFLAHQKLSDSAVRELVPGPFCTGRKSIWRRHCGWGTIGRRGTLFPHLRKMASDILWTQEERYEDGMWASCSYFASWKHLLAFRKKTPISSQSDRARALAASKMEYCETRTLSKNHWPWGLWLQQWGPRPHNKGQTPFYSSSASKFPLKPLYGIALVISGRYQVAFPFT